MTETPTLNPDKPRRFRRAGAILGAGLLASVIAAGIGGAASAQTVEITQLDQPAVAVQDVDDTPGSDLEVDPIEDLDLSPEDEAVFESFEQCLADAGIDVDSGEGELDEAALDAAFEQCDPLLDGLSDEGFFIDGDLSEEDEAIFKQYDECIENSGVDFEDENLDEASLEAAFETCDPILDNLSEGIDFDFALSPEDEAIFDQYDQCLTDGGLTEDAFEGDNIDEAAIDALFESCESVLENLSVEAQELFACPEE